VLTCCKRVIRCRTKLITHAYTIFSKEISFVLSNNSKKHIMSYTNADCIKAITQNGLSPICGSDTMPTNCSYWIDDPGTYHQLCMGPYMYQPVQAIICSNSVTGEKRVFPTDDILTACTNLHNQDPNWNLAVCYCCCSGAFGASIATPVGNAAVHDLQTGTIVHVGSVQGSVVQWNSQALALSSGLAINEPEEVITFVLDGTKKLSVTPDHVLMRADGKLVRAHALSLNDALMGATGEAVKITALGKERVAHTTHSISADASFDGTPKNHLINSNGIVCGDYTLELNFDQLQTQFKA
jgi:hypothetical protein